MRIRTSTVCSRNIILERFPNLVAYFWAQLWQGLVELRSDQRNMVLIVDNFVSECVRNLKGLLHPWLGQAQEVNSNEAGLDELTSSLGPFAKTTCSGATRRSSILIESVTTTHQPIGVGTLNTPPGHWKHTVNTRYTRNLAILTLRSPVSKICRALVINLIASMEERIGKADPAVGKALSCQVKVITRYVHTPDIWVPLTLRATELLIYENQNQYNRVASPRQRMGCPTSRPMGSIW